MANVIIYASIDNGNGSKSKIYSIYYTASGNYFLASAMQFILTSASIQALNLSTEDYEDGDAHTLDDIELILSSEDKNAGYIKIKDKIKAIAADATFDDDGKSWTDLESTQTEPPPVQQTEESVPDQTTQTAPVDTVQQENINNVAETKTVTEKKTDSQKDIKPTGKIFIDGYTPQPVVYEISHFNNPDGTYKSLVTKAFDVILTERVFTEIQSKNNVAKSGAKVNWEWTPEDVTIPVIGNDIEAAYIEMKKKLSDMWPLKFTKDKYLGEVISDVPESKAPSRETNNNTSDTDATINKTKLIDSPVISEEGKKNIVEDAKKEKKLVEKSKPSKEESEKPPIEDCDSSDNGTPSNTVPVIGPLSEAETYYEYSDEEIMQEYYETAENINQPSTTGATSQGDGDGYYYEDMLVEDENYGTYQIQFPPGIQTKTSTGYESSNQDSGGYTSSSSQSVNISSDGKSSLGGVNLDPKTMKASLEKKNYKWYPDGINLIGIRAKSIAPNRFNDLMVVVWYENGVEKFKAYKLTTYPGKDHLVKPIVPNRGCAIMKPGQYINGYWLGYHLSKSQGKNHPALCQAIGIPFYSDNTKTGTPHTDEATVVNNGVSIGMNIHRANRAGETAYVGPHSAGCQVFAVREQHNEFLAICEKFRKQTGNKFTYTLLKQEDVVVVPIQVPVGASWMS